MRERVVRQFLGKAETKVLEFARVGAGSALNEFFLVEREGSFYVLEYGRAGSNLSFDLISKAASRSSAKIAFDRALDQRLKGVQLMGGGHDAKVVSTRMDTDARKHLKAFDHPMVDIDWETGEEPENPQVDFLRFIKRQMKDWKGSSHQLSAARHEYWPEFQEMVHEAVRKKYGSNVTLYRGIYRDQAKEILDAPGTPIKLRTYSSWADSLEGGKGYRGHRDYWVVIKARFKAEDIALAPVVLPDFIEPDILMPLAHDVQHVGDELVVGPKKILNKYIVALKTRKLMAHILREKVVRRYLTAQYKEKKQVPSQDGGKTTVYVYSERQVANRNRKKAERLQKLGQAIKKIQAKVKKDLRSGDPETARTALAVALMDHTYERIGNDSSAKDGHFGVTGWKRSQVSFKSDGAFIKYTGKSGVKQEKKITDASIRKALREAYDDGNEGLLTWDQGRVTPDKVNAYLKSFGVTSKDIRGYHANNEMRKRLKQSRSGTLPSDKKEREAKLKTEFKEALEATAEAVGHEASTLRSQYLVPGLEDSYLKDGTIINKLGSWSFEDSPLAALPPDTHYRMTCKACGNVSQCRCRSCTKVELSQDSCEACDGEEEDLLPGGLGDKYRIEDFDIDQVTKGIEVEMEHTNDPEIAKDIVRDHLTEDPKYYDKLEVMESGDE
jgi:DNA topoisomerase IB